MSFYAFVKIKMLQILMNVLQPMVDVITFVLTFLADISVAVEVDTLWKKMAHALVIPESSIKSSYYMYLVSIYM